MNKDEIGRIVDKRHYDTICKFYDDSVDSIAEVIVGGRSQFQEDIRFIPPTVLRMRDTTCPLMTEELFSPILPVYAVDSYQQAVDLCNAREKPLSLLDALLLVDVVGTCSPRSAPRWRISFLLRTLEALR